MRYSGSTVKRRLKTAFRVLCIVATAGGLWWFLHGLDVEQLGETFQRAAAWPLVLAVLLNICGHLVRAEGWRVMLGARHPIPYGRLLRYELAAQAASALTPVRAGEVLRFWLLKQDRVPAATTGALIVLKKVHGAVGLALLVVATPWLVSGLPGWIRGFVAGFAALMVIELAVLVVVAHRVEPVRLPKFLSGVVGGMEFLRTNRRMLTAQGVMLVGEITDAAAVVVVLHALHVDLPIAAAILTLFLIDFSNMLPVAPGNLGTFEVGALYALNLLNVPQDTALAFALLFHAQQILPQIVLGLPLELRFIARGRRRGDNPAPLEKSAEHSRPGG